MKHNITHSRSQPLIDFACKYATEAHGDQKRKYTGDPYITHPIAVAQVVASVTDDCEMICAALLHDVIEDCERTYEDIRDAGFGIGIADLVECLTDVSVASDGNRRVRKEIDRQHTAKSSVRAKTVKLADLIHNSESILKEDENFAKVYMKEKKLLLEVLTEGDAVLYARAKEIVDNYYGGLDEQKHLEE